MNNKFKEWYHKPREGKLFAFSDWVLTSPFAFELVLVMGYIVSILLFAAITIWVWFLSEKNLLAVILPFGIFCVCVYKLYNYIKLKIHLRGDYIYKDMTLDDVTGNKYSLKNKEVKNEGTVNGEDDESEQEETTRNYRFFSERIQKNNKKSK